MIKDFLTGKTAKEKARIKAEKIAKLDHVGTFESAPFGVRVELQSIKTIEGGVEILARAWKGTEQLGFGDGSVDIERFRIFNPPIMVNDPNGDEVETWTDEQGKVRRRVMREDPIEAIRQSLAHTTSICGKTKTNIIEGKVGNTTSTFFAHGTGSGLASMVNQATWAAARNAVTADSLQQAATATFRAEQESAGLYTIDRGFYPFDTSALGDTDTIDSATFSVSVSGTGEGGTARSAALIQTTQGDPASLSTGDFDALTLNSPTEGATRDTLSSGTGYHNFTLNASGLSWISKTSYTKLGLRLARDVDNSSPGVERHYVQVYNVAQAGTTDDPKLVVVHTVVNANTMFMGANF